MWRRRSWSKQAMIIRKNPNIRFPNPDPSRVPPGQFVTQQWPVLHFGSIPQVDLATWKFSVWGEVENPVSWTWEQFQKLPRASRRNDVHCVTHWTRLDNDWEGVPVREVLKIARPKPSARFVIEHAVGGWTTNVPLSDLDRDENLLATHHGGKPLSVEHGAPMRIVIPHLYFWKGAKWASGLELTADDQAGFWEVNGYHMRGDPWKEERFRDDL